MSNAAAQSAAPVRARRYMTKRCACGAVTSALVTADDLRAADMHYGWPATQPAPGAGKIRASNGGHVLACRWCGDMRRATPVKGKVSPAHVCNAKCLASHGFTCECSCGGKNHGASYAVA